MYRLGRPVALLNQVQQVTDRFQRVVDLMRHHRRHLAPVFQLLGSQQAIEHLGLFALRAGQPLSIVVDAEPDGGCAP